MAKSRQCAMWLWLLLPVLCTATASPEQIRLSIGATPSSVVVTWTTFEAVPSADVRICEMKSLKSCEVRTGTSQLFIFDDEEAIGEPPIPRYIHSVTIEQVLPGTVYSYQVGCRATDVWDAPRLFRGYNADSTLPANFIAFGDLGTCSDLSLATVSALKNEALSLKYDFFIDIGDFAYNLNTNNGVRGDEFLRDIEGFASQSAFMTVVGNHERYQNYTHYRHLFRMPGDSEGFYYSFDVGPVHAVVYSSESVHASRQWPSIHEAQLAWLQRDLSSVDRTSRPWLFLFAHEPLYCSVDWNDPGEYQNCVVDAGARRHLYEDLFTYYGVDVHFHGHMHNYERLGPVAANRAAGSEVEASHLYVNPAAPVYVVSGAAGSCLEDDIAYSSSTPEEFSRFRTEELSYTRVVAEVDYMKVEQVSSATGEVLDYFYIVKTRGKE